MVPAAGAIFWREEKGERNLQGDSVQSVSKMILNQFPEV
jgi:hypothetical protein